MNNIICQIIVIILYLYAIKSNLDSPLGIPYINVMIENMTKNHKTNRSFFTKGKQ